MENKIKIECFKELKYHLHLIGVLRANSSEKERKSAIIKNCVVLGVLISTFISIAWFRLFSAQSVREISESSSNVLTSLLLIAWYSTLVWKREDYAAVFDEIDAKIEQSLDDPAVESIYYKSNQRIERVTKLLFWIIQIMSAVYSLFPIGSSIFKYMITGFCNEAFQPIYPAVYLFDYKTPIGYFVLFLIQIQTMIIGIECFVSPIMLTIGFCIFITDFASDLGVKLHQINKDVVELEGKKATANQEIWLKKKLGEFIQLHTDAREFAIRFSHVNEGVVFACPAFTIAVFGMLILQSKTIIGSGDFIAILQTIIVVFGSLLPFFLFCNFGGNVTHQFEILGSEVYQLEWYDLPIEMQKQLPIIIASTQKRIYMRGFGDTRTTYYIFNKVMKNKFFYFILARKL